MRRLLFVCLLILGLIGGPAYADVPGKMSLQGRVVDSTGTPIDATVDITFRLYSDKLATNQIWSEVQSNVEVSNGRFDVLLGSVVPLTPTILDGSVRYLSMQVGSGPESKASIQITSSAYSLRAARADTAAFAISSAANGWVHVGGVLHPETSTDSVGIGTDNPRTMLDVVGPVTAITGQSTGTGTAIGVFGANDNDGIGVLGTSSSGKGVQGISTTGFAGYFYGPKSFFAADVGVGTETPEEKLHLYTATSGARSFLKIQSTHASNWGEAGLRIETPQNLWHLRMDDDSNNQIPDGALGLRSQDLGDEVIVFTQDGDVGVGTTAPTYRLDVESSTGALRGTSTAGGYGVVGSSSSSAGVYGFSSTGYGGYFSGPKHYFDGLLGLATTSPTHRLTVNGAIGVQDAGDTKFHINYYNGGLNFSETTVADYRLNLEAGGNVGIGTGNPQEKLHVAGNAKIDGTLITGGFESDAMTKENILDEVGIASSGSASSNALGTSFSAYLTRQITVPTAGYILATGFAYFSANHGVSGSTAATVAISSISDAIDGGQSSGFYISHAADAGIYGTTTPCQRLFFCPSAGPYTYYMIASRGDDNDVTIVSRQMDLLFIPTVYASTASEQATDTPDDLALEAGGEPLRFADVAALERQREADQAALSVHQATDGETDMARVLAELTSLRNEVAALKSRIASKR